MGLPVRSPKAYSIVSLTPESHGNSIEKLPDGDYLLSGRRTYAVYKISHKDGSIVWRLGGKKSDFKIDGHFSGYVNEI